MTTRRALTRIRKVCLALPDTEETLTWGKPHFRVGGKIFAGYNDEADGCVLGFKLAMDHAAARIAADPRVSRAPYVGRYGWVSMDVATVTDWGEVRALILESYRLIAPKKSLAKLDGGALPDRERARPKRPRR